MLPLLSKEIRTFFSSISGYLILSIFLIATGLFVWVFPGNSNPLDSGDANLNVLFEMAPWIYLFLIPAVCMRFFAEEKKQGTIELLMTRPISDMGIVLAKYFAGLTIVVFSLLFCLVYYYSVYYLGNPIGNIDSGAFWGSFIGLFLLAGVYVSIGVFASSLTENQIVAFLLALVFCFIFYIGFDYLGEFASLQSLQNSIISMGINQHYRSISRGIVDSRDLLYFIGVIMGFLLLTQTVLKSRKW
ncbi:gliding motility-associated ABC transporter permease subunit GldF [Labilibaculum filiforme]|uniref:gliding motility-associated ABC transporter permease subunit GldF n=1 Tax=Labilibaculum filiforme TaxID=1940526 RepID=UPI000C6E5677|nr:gliding motility-associated ABC transporter permease subunit GldF [Labilibaculum filiforme]